MPTLADRLPAQTRNRRHLSQKPKADSTCGDSRTARTRKSAVSRAAVNCACCSRNASSSPATPGSSRPGRRLCGPQTAPRRSASGGRRRRRRKGGGRQTAGGASPACGSVSSTICAAVASRSAARTGALATLGFSPQIPFQIFLLLAHELCLRNHFVSRQFIRYTKHMQSTSTSN